jgi:thiamine biosynthesis lipoprotein
MYAALLGLVLHTLYGATADGSSTLKRFESSQVAMGTTVVVVLYAPDEATANRAFAAAFKRIAFLDKMMSDYDSDSELMRLCSKSPTANAIPVSRDLNEVLSYAQDMSEKSEGAFDVTVGPLTKLWRRARRREEMPDPQQLAEALAAVGYKNLIVHKQQSTVELRKPNMRIDLGGIAQGYAADVAMEELQKLGINRALVNVSGEILGWDPPPDSDAWTVGIAPLEPNQPPSHFVRLVHNAVATSGDAWQFAVINGRRYSHVLDPHTGIGLTVHCGVSVVAPTAMAADAISTAVGVLGVERGLAFIEKMPDTAALIVRQEDGHVTVHESSKLETYLKKP